MRSTAEKYGIYKSAVFGHIAGVAKSCKHGSEIVFSENEEKELASILLRVLKKGLRDVHYKHEHGFSRDTKHAGRK